MGHSLRDLTGSLSPQCTCVVVLCPNPGRPRACRGAVDSSICSFLNDQLQKMAGKLSYRVMEGLGGCLHERKDDAVHGEVLQPGGSTDNRSADSFRCIAAVGFPGGGCTLFWLSCMGRPFVQGGQGWLVFRNLHLP